MTQYTYGDFYLSDEVERQEITYSSSTFRAHQTAGQFITWFLLYCLCFKYSNLLMPLTSAFLSPASVTLRKNILQIKNLRSQKWSPVRCQSGKDSILLQ